MGDGQRQAFGTLFPAPHPVKASARINQAPPRIIRPARVVLVDITSRLVTLTPREHEVLDHIAMQ